MLLAERIRTKEATVGVIGLGYVGLPLLVALNRAGFPTVGLDADSDRLEQLKRGQSYLVDVSDSEVRAMRAQSLSSAPEILKQADIMVICVPTPLTDSAPDLRFVRQAGEAAGDQLTPGCLVILESTTYPGTTEEELIPLLEKQSGLTAGVDFAVAFSPERIDPGQDEYVVEEIPKVVGGFSDTCRNLAVSFYQSFVRSVVGVSTPREAEMAKLIENTFRHVNIALVNELAIVARELNVDIWEALRAAATKPFGFMPFWPGPGVGGHCIPIDPSYLSWRVNQLLGYRTGFIEHANEINRRMPGYVVSRIAELLNEAGKALKGAHILCIGASYKPGVADLRDSPAVEVMTLLADRGATISYHDEFVAELTLNGGGSLESIPITKENLSRHDCVVVLTTHPGIDWELIARESPLVFDSRGAIPSSEFPNVSRL